LATVSAAVFAIAGASARVQPVAAPAGKIAAVDVSNRAGLVLQNLIARGIDPKGLVIQNGAHNYAGPSCPGVGWTCTTSKRVLQFGPNNQFECTASSGFVTPPNQCVIIQSSAGASNTARCVETSGEATVSQSCLIYQTNTTGTNRAEIRQRVDANWGTTQYANQYAGITQTNTSGKNDARVSQDLNQSTRDITGGVQTQDGHQTTSIYQQNDTGDNGADVFQSLALKAQASGVPSITQNQDTDGAINTDLAVRQYSTSGRNDTHTI